MIPTAFAALAAGQIDPVHVRIIEDETRYLSPDDAARADEFLAASAPSQTFGQLRYAAHRLVLKLDPDAARRRQEAAKREAHVRRFREDSGNAGMVARELPPDEVLASWQHVEQRALDLRAAGLPGTLTELRVRAYLDLLQERDSRGALGDPSPAGSGQPAGPDEPGRPGQPAGPGEPFGPGADGAPDGHAPGGPSDPGDGDDGPGTGGIGGTGSGPRPGPVGSGGRGAARRRPDPGPRIAALVNITVPLSTLAGASDTPGEAAGFGLLDGQDARDLVAAAARHPDTRWCVTAVHPDGTAAAHGCARGRHPPPASFIPGRGGLPGPGPPGPGPPGTRPPGYLPGLPVTMTPIARGRCGHDQAEAGYRPSRQLTHLIKVRNARCTAPGCGRPAARCDLDHTIAWDHGGITCECGLAPLCRHHHRCKQAEGWRLGQPEPGVLVWRTPVGRSYATTPTQYPM